VEFSRALIETSGYRRTGFAAHYDRYRPRPPEALLDQLCRYARVERPRLVVDLGCGTGLSTRAWSGRAERAVGVEPNPAMLAVAAPAPGVEYREAFAHETGLDDGCADVVTCSQSLHWMEPEPVFAEVARLLRPDGVFAAYDYDWPPFVDPDVDEAFDAYQERRGALVEKHGIVRGADRWAKREHLERMRASGRFRFAREIVLHASEEGTVERLIGFALSLGPLVVLLNEGVSKEEVGLANLREVVARALGDRTVTWYFCYRARLAVK
jgi:SAM-dependent methyltransferase